MIKKIPIREYDELMICYTRDSGKQTYQLKSSLRHTSKQGRHLDILSHTDFNLVEGHVMPIIVSARCLNSFYGIKSDLHKLSRALFVLECFDKIVPENEPDDLLWQGIFNLIKLCDNSDIDILHKNILNLLGYSANSSVEEVAQAKFMSLDFARKIA